MVVQCETEPLHLRQNPSSEYEEFAWGTSIGTKWSKLLIGIVETRGFIMQFCHVILTYVCYDYMILDFAKLWLGSIMVTTNLYVLCCFVGRKSISVNPGMLLFCEIHMKPFNETIYLFGSFDMETLTDGILMLYVSPCSFTVCMCVYVCLHSKHC